jgi:3-phenylpropionate/trans-cinnamate dioxygenase ferredoxin subunit
MATFFKIATANELAPGQAKRVEAQGKRLALFNLDGRYYAIEDTCTHRGGPLSEGEIEGDVVICPWHGAKFRIASGEVLAPPARTGVASFPIRLNGSDVEVEL